MVSVAMTPHCSAVDWSIRVKVVVAGRGASLGRAVRHDASRDERAMWLGGGDRRGDEPRSSPRWRRRSSRPSTAPAQQRRRTGPLGLRRGNRPGAGRDRGCRRSPGGPGPACFAGVRSGSVPVPGPRDPRVQQRRPPGRGPDRGFAHRGRASRRAGRHRVCRPHRLPGPPGRRGATSGARQKCGRRR